MRLSRPDHARLSAEIFQEFGHFHGLSDEVISRDWSVSFTPVVNAEDADQIRWFEARKNTRHLPTRKRSSPGRSFRDFTSPWPVAAKRTRAASMRAWTTRSRRAKSRTAAGRKTTRRITARAGVGPRPRGHRRPVPRGPNPAWPQSRHPGLPAHPVPLEKKWPPALHYPEGHPRAIEGGYDRRTYSDYNFAGGQPFPGDDRPLRPEQGRRSYFPGRDPVMRISTSRLALCCHSGLVATFDTPISARSRSIGSRSLRISPLLIARFTKARIASQI